MSISSDDDTDSTEESDGKHYSEYNSDVDMHMEDDVDAPYGTYDDGGVDMERDGDDIEEHEEDDDEVEDDEEE